MAAHGIAGNRIGVRRIAVVGFAGISVAAALQNSALRPRLILALGKLYGYVCCNPLAIGC